MLAAKNRNACPKIPNRTLLPTRALLKYVHTAESDTFPLALLIRFFATGHLIMKFLGSTRVSCLLFLAGVLLASAVAETIHLKNGRTIFADSVREANGRVEYTIGDNTFSISKASVVSIDSGGSPIVTAASDIPAVTSQPDLNIHNIDDLTAKLIVNGKVDTDLLGAIDREGNADKAASAYWLASRNEENHGSYETAAKYMARAASFLPENAIIQTHYGSVLLRLGRLKDAEAVADRAVHLDPQMASAFAVLGFAEYQLSKTKEAVVALQRSLKLEPNAQVAEILKKAQRELAAEGDFTQENSSHFTMRYEGGQAPPAFRREILQTLEHHFDDLSRDFNFVPRETIHVVLYNDKQYFDVTQAPSWAGALYDGKLRMPISGLTAMTSDLSRVLKHELTHSFITAIAKGRCPTWLNEGIAQLEEPRSSRSQGSRLAALYTTQHNIPLNQLEASFTQFSTAEANVAYVQSLTAVEYIRDTYGLTQLIEVVKRLGDGQSTESALRSSIHSGYGQLEQELTAYLKRNYGG
jgi:tetratricopeptide (TPR) repeat protein